MAARANTVHHRSICSDVDLRINLTVLTTFLPAGKETVNSMYGTRVAVLAGDFLFAESSWGLAQLDNLEVRLPCLFVVCVTVSSRTRCTACW